MAVYDYKCTECGNQFEVEHPMNEHPDVSCPKCGSEAKRVFVPSGIVFQGSGFYNTDQKNSK
ncbi:MAG: zinc ribbon domain-containing protein [Coriobacteriaceae bacterium]|jgi:putative FmdB family regulatory protein|nr:zinc ribbon domain-containing protein [Olsenella sp.]MCI1288751.1 zinc ribbon domain-containing protein [Olsenella sp.]RRF91254.1 MAG: zinc ribbon domain-containing protein [Coriobacteriaceae bacterium]